MDKNYFAALLALWLVVHAFLFYHYGVRSLFDANGYIKGADFLLKNGRLEDVHHLFYGVPIALMAFFRWLFPGQIIPFLVFQSVVSAIAVLALYRSGCKLFNNRLAGFLAGAIFLLWLDNIHWNTTAMTESLACSAICFIIYRLVFFEGTIRDYVWLAMLMIILFFIRPTGVITIAGTLAFLLRFYWRFITSRPVLKFSIATAILLFGFFGAALMFQHWDFSEEYLKGNIVTYMHTLEGNPLYHPGLRMAPPPDAVIDVDKPAIEKIFRFIFYNPLHFIKTSSLKIWYLLSATRPYYSGIHNAYIFTWMSFIYLMFCVGWSLVKKNPIVIFTLTVVVVNCGVIALSTVDWDNRFYIPMEPGIVLLSGGGAAYILARLKLKVSL